MKLNITVTQAQHLLNKLKKEKNKNILIEEIIQELEFTIKFYEKYGY